MRVEIVSFDLLFDLVFTEAKSSYIPTIKFEFNWFVMLLEQNMPNLYLPSIFKAFRNGKRSVRSVIQLGSVGT